MPTKTNRALAALLLFGAASATDHRLDQSDSIARRVMPVANGRAKNHRLKPLNAGEKEWFAVPQVMLVQSEAFCRPGTPDRVWIRLTEPGGKPIHINVDQVSSVRADTQIPGARAQLDFASGKFQGVQESADQVMQLITATPGARDDGERA